jgi:hypothetical protein
LRLRRNALAGDREVLAHFLEGVLGPVAEADAHLDDLLVAGSEGLEERLGLLLQVDVDHGLGGGDHVAVLDEVSQMRVFLLADGGLQGDGLLGDLQDLIRRAYPAPCADRPAPWSPARCRPPTSPRLPRPSRVIVLRR